MKNTQTIKDFYGVIIGYIEEDNNGNKKAFDFYRRVLGTYDKRTDVTKDFYGRVIAKGDITQSLVWGSKNK